MVQNLEYIIQIGKYSFFVIFHPTLKNFIFYKPQVTDNHQCINLKNLN